MTATIATYTAYNTRRHGRPWVAVVQDDGRNLTFLNANVLGDATAGGSLIVEDPQECVTYAFGQKDIRQPGWSANNRAIWNGTAFVLVDREGNQIDGLADGYNLTFCDEPQVDADAAADAETDAEHEAETAPAALTDAEVAAAIADAVYSGEAVPGSVHVRDLIESALRNAIWGSRRDNAGALSTTYFIECRDAATWMRDCINVVDGDHMEWAACYEPTLRLEEAQAKAGGTLNPQRTERIRNLVEQRRPLATYRYTLTDDKHGTIGQVDILVPEQQKRAAKQNQEK